MFENDKQSIVKAFDAACGYIADNLPQILGEAELDENGEFVVEIPLNVNIIDIDYWWAIKPEKNSPDFESINLNNWGRKGGVTSDAFRRFVARGSQQLEQTNPAMFAHVMANMDTVADTSKAQKLAKYLPHEIDYAYPDLMKLDGGFKRLQDRMTSEHPTLGLKFMMTPNKDAQHLFEEKSYELFAVFEKGGMPSEPSSTTPTPQRRLN